MGCLVEDAPVVTGAADFPEFVIEWLPLGGPFSVDGEWCPITFIDTTSTFGGGRQYEIGDFAAQTSTDVLKLATRDFDVENAVGPFYPHLRTYKQIRKSAVWSGVRYPLWHGYITDYNDVTPDDVYFQQTLSAKDAFVVFESIDLPASWYELAVMADRPTHWWKLDETGSVPIDSISDNRALGFYDAGLPTLGAQAIVPYDAGRVCTTWNEAFITLGNWSPHASSGDGFSIEGWFQIDNADLPATTNGYPLWYFGTFDDTGIFTYVQLQMWGATSGSAGELRGFYSTDAGDNVATTSARYDDGLPHHYVVTLDTGNGDIQVFIDGLLDATDSGGTTEGWMDVSLSGTAAKRSAIGSGRGTNPHRVFPGTMSHVIVYEGQILSADQVLTHYTAGYSAFAGDTTGENAARILNYMGWPEALRDIDTACSATIGSYNLTGNLASYLKALSETELGAMFMDAENRLVFRGRYATALHSRSTTSTNVFGDGRGAATLFYSKDDFSLRRDDTLIRNPITASRSGGISVTVEDTTLSDPETGNGRRDWSAPASLDRLDSAMNSRAHRLLAMFKDANPRLANMKLQLRRSAGLIPAVLGMKNQDRITVQRTPLGSGAEISVDQYVESIVHTVSPTSWDTRVIGAPVDDTDYLIVGVGLVGVGRVG